MGVILEKKRLKGAVVNKDALILKLCRGKIVLHLGCADHPFSIEQHQTGKLLHEKLHTVARKVSGIDISQKGVDFLKSLGYENLLVRNVEDLGELDFVEKQEVIVAGELLEHLSNVGGFFENILSVMDENSILIVTVPNTHSLKGFMRVLLGNELIHRDHVYYFSPAAIEHFCKRYGYKVLEYFYYLSEPNGILKKILFIPVKYFIRFVSPNISDGLILILKKKLKNG